MIAHEIFQDQLTEDLVRAGLPIAATFSASLTSGIRLESDTESAPPACFLNWRVHSSFTPHFLALSHAELLGDPQVQAMRNTQQAMNTAITTILEFAGYQVTPAHSERPGALFVTRAEPASS